MIAETGDSPSRRRRLPPGRRFSARDCSRCAGGIGALPQPLRCAVIEHAPQSHAPVRTLRLDQKAADAVGNHARKRSVAVRHHRNAGGVRLDNRPRGALVADGRQHERPRPGEIRGHLIGRTDPRNSTVSAPLPRVGLAPGRPRRPQAGGDVPPSATRRSSPFSSESRPRKRKSSPGPCRRGCAARNSV